METYLNELESWCHEWRTIFIENTQKRTLEQQALLLEEKALLYDPLNNVRYHINFFLLLQPFLIFCSA